MTRPPVRPSYPPDAVALDASGTGTNGKRRENNQRFPAKWGPPVPAAAPEGSGVLMVLAGILIVLHLARPFDVVLVGLHIPFVICGLAAVAALSVAGLRSLASTQGLLISALTAWMVLVAPFSTWKGGTFYYIRSYVFLRVVLFMVIAAAPKTIAQVRTLMRLLGATVFAAVIVFSIMARHSGVNSLDNRSGGVGMFGNEGEFALLIGFILPFWVFAASTIGNRLFRLVLMAGGTMLLFSLLVRTGTRSAFFAIAPAAVFLLTRVNMTRKLLLIVAGLVLVFGSLAVTPEKTLQRLITLGMDDGSGLTGNALLDHSEAAESARERKELLMDALQTIARNPLFGVGAGNFTTYRYNVLGAAHHKHWLPAHNTYLQIAAENGIVGGLIYLALVVSVFLTTFKVRRRFSPGRPQYDLVNQMTLCIQVSLVFFAVMSAFQNCDTYPQLFILGGLSTALERLTRPSAHGPDAANRVPTRAGFGPIHGGKVLQRPLRANG